jgi:hypothetical protein
LCYRPVQPFPPEYFRQENVVIPATAESQKLLSFQRKLELLISKIIVIPATAESQKLLSFQRKLKLLISKIVVIPAEAGTPHLQNCCHPSGSWNSSSPKLLSSQRKLELLRQGLFYQVRCFIGRDSPEITPRALEQYNETSLNSPFPFGNLLIQRSMLSVRLIDRSSYNLIFRFYRLRNQKGLLNWSLAEF